MPSRLELPPLDPTAIFELHRGAGSTELLAAAVSHFDLFTRLATGPLSFDALRAAVGLEPRAANVLFTALRAMGLLTRDKDGRFDCTALSRDYLARGARFDTTGYIGLAAQSAGVREMVERLRTNRPAGAKPDEDGVAFIFRDGIESAMEQQESARRFTLALAGRAKIVAPALARAVDLSNDKLLLDIAGGTGIYAIAFLQKYPGLRAIVLDRAEVLKVAREMATEYGVVDRMEFRAGDMFSDSLPRECDAVLLSNVLHDWDVDECRKIVSRCAAALKPNGRLLVHDVFLNDALDGPLPVALYSANLFSVTEGRAYSAAEYRAWLIEAGLSPAENVVPTLVHCGVLVASRRKG